MDLYSSKNNVSAAEVSLESLKGPNMSTVNPVPTNYMPADAADEDFIDELSLILLEGVHQKSSKQVENALERLADLCSQCEATCREACQMGAPSSALAIMRKWKSSKTVQVRGLRVLVALTICSNCTKIRKTLWMIGAMEAVLEEMQSFLDSRAVQFFGCSAILSLLPCSSGDVKDEKLTIRMGRRFVGEMNGIKSVITGMIRFENDREIQETGCHILLKLATFMNAGNDRKMLLKSGAVSAFSVALESNSNDEEIQIYATLFMNLLSSDFI